MTDTNAHTWNDSNVAEPIRRGTFSALEAFGVDVVFQGQSQAYERFRFSFTDPAATADVHRDFGVHYIVTGGGGSLPDDVRLATPSPGVVGRQRGLTTYNQSTVTARRTGAGASLVESLELTAYELGGPGALDRLALTRTWEHPSTVLVAKSAEGPPPYEWRYFQSGAPPPDWKRFDFDDSTWTTVAGTLGEFGFGDGDEAVALSSGQAQYFFRRRFNLPAGVVQAGDVVELRVVVDDACEVYLSNSSDPDGTQVASVAAGLKSGVEERRWHFLRILPLGASWTAGDYVLAIEVSQAPGDNGDLSFWAELVVKRPAP